jgi:hypothetical protein
VRERQAVFSESRNVRCFGAALKKMFEVMDGTIFRQKPNNIWAIGSRGITKQAKEQGGYASQQEKTRWH